VKQAKGDLAGALAAYTRAIELNPKGATFYHSRGCLHYDDHEFTDAMADFRQAIELDAAQDYSHLRLWLAGARAGETKSATKELRSYLRDRKTGKMDDWEATIMRFLTGQMTERAFFNAAIHNGDKQQAGKQCEAYYYAGSKRLVEGNKKKAADYFQQCLATDKK